MPELDGEGGFFAPPQYKIGSQNTPYKLGLNSYQLILLSNCLIPVLTQF